MTKPKQIKAKFEGYDQQVFPQGLDALNGIYAEFNVLYPDSRRGDFVQKVRESRGLDVTLLSDPETEDNFKWQAGITLGSNEVAVLFPDSAGLSDNHTYLRRSVNVYAGKNTDKGVIDFFVEELILGIMGVKKSKPYGKI